MTLLVTVAIVLLLLLALIASRSTQPAAVVVTPPIPARTGDGAFVFLMALIVLAILLLQSLH